MFCFLTLHFAFTLVHSCFLHTAGVYFDVLRQFNPKEGPGDPEMDRRRIYCKWKAGDILKAVKEGRAPTPGGVGEEVSP